MPKDAFIHSKPFCRGTSAEFVFDFCLVFMHVPVCFVSFHSL